MRTNTSERILTASVPVDVAETIRNLAREDDRTTSAYIRRLLREHVRETRGRR